MPDPSSPQSAIRASNAERQTAVSTLHTALGDGRLDLSEADDRIAAAYSARFRHELAPLVADLPAATAGPSARDSLVLLIGRQKLAVLVAAVALLWFLVFAVLGAAFT